MLKPEDIAELKRLNEQLNKYFFYTGNPSRRQSKRHRILAQRKELLRKKIFGEPTKDAPLATQKALRQYLEQKQG